MPKNQKILLLAKKDKIALLFSMSNNKEKFIMAYRQNVAPRWRGFNLLGMFCSESSDFYKKTITTLNSTEKRSPGYFKEEEFQIISDWGFDFVRLPLSYRVWGDVKDPFKIDEKKLEPLDEAVYWAQ